MEFKVGKKSYQIGDKNIGGYCVHPDGTFVDGKCQDHAAANDADSWLGARVIGKFLAGAQGEGGK